MGADTQAKYDRAAPWYDLFEFPAEAALFRRWRKRLIGMISEKRVLEAGAGTGKNLAFYRPGVELTAIDFSPRMAALARQRATGRGLAASVDVMDVQSLAFGDDCFDAAAATFVFCSVPQPVRGLSELYRVLKPGARLYMLEHVRPGGPLGGAIFDFANIAATALMGVHINRATAKNIRAARFEIEREYNLLGTVFKLFVARKRT
jgi:ubiquinone/menaquinone biosynthesis C-methylase UbiE